MAAYINKRETYTGAGDKDWIQLNRWSEANDYTIVVRVTGTVNYDVVGTIDYINRPLKADNTAAPTPVDIPITALTGLAVDANEVIQSTPFEAIKVVINSGAGSVDFHVMQNGAG
jgi:hypothetical protein